MKLPLFTLTDLKDKSLSRMALCKQIRQRFLTAQNELNQQFWQKKPISTLLKTRSNWLDHILCFVWQYFSLDKKSLSLLAVGGYGAQRIHPQSDVDILIVTLSSENTQLAKLEDFISFVWDLGIKLGSSFRTIDECLDYAKNDLCIYTNLLNSRFIIGSKSIYHALKHEIENETLWTFIDFFNAKVEEQRIRYQRHDHTEFNLEPSIKESPGGLRDIDLITWLTQKKYRSGDFKKLLLHGDITQKEYDALNQGRKFLLSTRYALHLLAKGPTERLYFEHQALLAQNLGYERPNINESISSFMQVYYRFAQEIREICSTLCQHFREITASPYPTHKIKHLDDFSYIVDDYLEITPKTEMSLHDIAALFLHLAQHEEIQHFSAQIRRLIRNSLAHKSTVTSSAQHIFMRIFQTSTGCAKALALMNRLGVLKLYIPEFAHIMGQMQYDLYHQLTVDAHTLLLLSNIEKFYRLHAFLYFEHLEECQQQARHPEVLYLSGLFHDIGKGQGGDHSLIGAKTAQAFCQNYQLSLETTELIVWLVKHHLLMSITAQQCDISDQAIVAQFAKAVQTRERLCYLYMLTVADIHATNPNLWNSWRASLLSQLYLATTWFLQQKSSLLENLDTNKIKSQILSKLSQTLEAPLFEQVIPLWQNYPDYYFQLESIPNIIWQTQYILKDSALGNRYTIAVKPHWNQVGTDIFIYAQNHPNLFAYVCAMMEKILLTIVQARIIATLNDYCLLNFVVLEISGQPITQNARLAEIELALSQLKSALAQGDMNSLPFPFISRHIARKLKYFAFNTHVRIYTPENSDKTIVEVHAPDFPGLLARVARAFVSCELMLHSAKINTLGNKVEDTFTITCLKTQQPLLKERDIQQLKQLIEQSITPHTQKR